MLPCAILEGNCRIAATKNVVESNKAKLNQIKLVALWKHWKQFLSSG